MSAERSSHAHGGRPLSPGELHLARSVFADTIDYARVRIHHRNFVFWQGANYIITPNGHIYLGRNLRQLTDFSATNLALQGLFIHEMAHVWQYQRGVNVLLRGAAEQARHFLGFNQYRYRLQAGKPLTAYKLEQQGDILRDFFLAAHGQRTPYGTADYIAALGGQGNTIV
ncbi:hypothetical protein [Cupriavidus pauculus]|uniref:hypothetical protein n=1 Tax=Cupriavidus pauculus TaxID=82633 RepID=UPI001EE32611|nr:hypothetical protein [Cupriavidus pauculus]GJG96185.1 hypothetical protein CBA19C6_16870 [Cupriavidus pauculus]